MEQASGIVRLHGWRRRHGELYLTRNLSEDEGCMIGMFVVGHTHLVLFAHGLRILWLVGRNKTLYGLARQPFYSEAHEDRES